MSKYIPIYKVKCNAYVSVGDILHSGIDMHRFIQIYVYDSDDDIQMVNFKIDYL